MENDEFETIGLTEEKIETADVNPFADIDAEIAERVEDARQYTEAMASTDLAAMAPTDETALITTKNQSLITHLPFELATRISQEVKIVKISKTAAQEIVNRYEAACPNIEDLLARLRSRPVTSSDDKDGMLENHKNRMESVKLRTAIDLVRVELKADAKAYVDMVDPTGRAIREALQEAEEVAAFNENFKKREAAEAREKLYRERQALVLPYLSIHDAEPHGIADMTEAAFNEVLNSARHNFYKRIADDRRVELAKWGWTEEVEGLGEMSDPIWTNFLAAAKATFELNQMAAANAQRKREERIKQLSQIGLRFAGVAGFCYDELCVTDVQISVMDDVAFSQTVTDFAEQIKQRDQAKAEVNARTREQEDKRVKRINGLSSIGMQRNGDGYIYDELRLTDWEIDADDDESFWAKAAAIAAQITERENTKRIDAETAATLARERAENERLAREAALAPDKDKVVAYFAAVHDVVTAQPAVESPALKELLERFFRDQADITNKYATEAANL